eukprot:SAG31_NODE_11025_length_1073_cov_0.981520_2_plen_39_part_01
MDRGAHQLEVVTLLFGALVRTQSCRTVVCNECLESGLKL